MKWIVFYISFLLIKWTVFLYQFPFNKMNSCLHQFTFVKIKSFVRTNNADDIDNVFFLSFCVTWEYKIYETKQNMNSDKFCYI